MINGAKGFRQVYKTTNCAFLIFNSRRDFVIQTSTVNIWNTLPAATLDQPNIAKFKDELDRFY